MVGIDAGGTKTRAFAVTRGGEIVGRGAGGGGNLLSSPDPQGSIAAALREALAGRQPDAIVLSCSGGERDADRAKGRAILAGLVGPKVPVEVTHDALAALYAGNPSGCGVVLISGTTACSPSLLSAPGPLPAMTRDPPSTEGCTSSAPRTRASCSRCPARP